MIPRRVSPRTMCTSLQENFYDLRVERRLSLQKYYENMLWW